MIAIPTLVIDAVSLTQAVASISFSGSKCPKCDDLAQSFGLQIDPSPSLRDPLQLLAIICSWRLRPDREEEPFDFVFCPSTTMEEINDQQLEAITSALPSMNVADLKARLCDILWIRRRSHEHARVAATEYLVSAECLIRESEILGVHERLTRAIQLSARLGRTGELFSSIVDRITRLAECPNLQHCELADCLKVLLASRAADPVQLHKIAVNRAQRISTNDPNPIWERGFWEIASGFAAQQKNEDLRRSATIEIARTYEREAQLAPSQSVAAHFWGNALHTYRQIGGADDDRNRVHQLMLKAQGQISKEMVPIVDETCDISDLVQSARIRIQGKNKLRALAELILATQWPAKDYVRQQAVDQIESYPLSHLFSTVRFSSTWKVSATAAGVTPSSSDIDPDRLNAEMCQQFRFFVPFAASGTIEPMREVMLNEHSIALNDIAEFVVRSPRVPHGREGLFTIGIHAGVHGRFVEALHILIPQLEHSLRYLLEATGTVTSSFDNRGVQKEFYLNDLLTMPETESLIGQDLCFAMRVLLTEQHGHNLRNEMAHGMLPTSAFYTDYAVYTWWLILNYVARPIATVICEQDRTNAGAATSTDDDNDSTSQTENMTLPVGASDMQTEGIEAQTLTPHAAPPPPHTPPPPPQPAVP